MKKVLIIHGFEGRPNGGWRPWLLAELDQRQVYACALPMPSPERPRLREWLHEISRQIPSVCQDIILVGHSLGVLALLHFLQNHSLSTPLKSAIFIAGPIKEIFTEKPDLKIKLQDFFDVPLDFKKIRNKAHSFVVIHGDNDDVVPYEHGVELSKNLECRLITVHQGGHLNRDSGHLQMPILLDEIQKLI